MLSLLGTVLAAPLLAGALTVPGTVGNGDLFVVTVEDRGNSPTEVTFLDRRYPPLKGEGRKAPFFLLAVDLGVGKGEYPLVARYGNGGESREYLVKVAEREFPVERLSLPPKMVTPPAEVLERIARERKAAAEVYATSAAEGMWSPPFARPTDGKPSGNFGRKRILNDKPKSPHSGEDYKAPRGTEVRAAAAGRVMMADDLYYSGNTVLIDHGAGLVSQYFHLERTTVRKGDTVERGARIGKVGATGRVTGPHLHFGIRLFGQRADPSMLWELFPAD